MKLIIGFMLMLVMSIAHAETTVCASNAAGGAIHLMVENKALGLSPSGKYIKGEWSYLGDTQIIVFWEDDTSSIYPLSTFYKCEL